MIERNDLTIAALRSSSTIANCHARIVLILWLGTCMLPAIVATFGVVVDVRAQVAPEPSIKFTNVTTSAGIKFTHFKGNSGISINREEFGPGLCVADFDGDGWQGIYFVNGRDLYNRGITARNAL